MTDEEWKKAKASMPWQSKHQITALGGEYRLVDNKGKDVPIPLMMEVVERVTILLSKQS